jgi:hypothetical protein
MAIGIISVIVEPFAEPEEGQGNDVVNVIAEVSIPVIEGNVRFTGGSFHLPIDPTLTEPEIAVAIADAAATYVNGQVFATGRDNFTTADVRYLY